MISKLRAPGELTDKSRPSRELQVQLIEVKFGGSASSLNGETLTEVQIQFMRQACHSFHLLCESIGSHSEAAYRAFDGILSENHLSMALAFKPRLL